MVRLCPTQPRNMIKGCLQIMIVLHARQDSTVQYDIWPTPNTCYSQQQFQATLRGHIMKTVCRRTR